MSADDSGPPARPIQNALPGLDRRGFLRGAAGGGVAVAIASMLPAGCAAEYPQSAVDGIDLHSLTAKEYAIVRAAAEAMLEGVPVTPASVAAAIDRDLALVGDPVRADFKSLLGLVEHLTILRLRRRTFTELDPAARLSYLDDWARSRFALRRGAYRALCGFITYFAWIRDETRALSGFAGPFPERVSIPATPVDFGQIA
ncbi:MAG: twin-arginine translocation signal domain-containing protein [Gemmatimonadetes bacterium]|nr:twin-arginine translocation signal domain-containing protein [Gemmatimonadota bacterium]